MKGTITLLYTHTRTKKTIAFVQGIIDATGTKTFAKEPKLAKLLW